MKRMFSTLSLLTTVALVLAACTPGTDDDTRNFNVNIENVGSGFPVLKSGAVASPGGPDDGPAIFPGETATFSFTAPPNTTPMSGMRLNLVTMFVQSNDLFYAFAPEGLALYDENGDAVTGDVTDQLFLYDAGTEEDQVPGANASDNQKPNQTPTETNKGPDENETVQLVENAPTNGFSYPDKADVIQVTLEHDGSSTFTVNVTNVSTPDTLVTPDGSKPVPLSPFAYAVHVDGFRLFEVGQPAGEGVERIAEDGFPGGTFMGVDLPGSLADELAEMTGVTVPLSPGAYAVHTNDFQPFSVGSAASEGIEAIAEDGVPMTLAETLAAADEVGDSGAFGPPPATPGQSFSFQVEASPGDRLSFATMYVQSNDIFYAFGETGLALFDADGNPVSGDVTAEVVLYDAGTEVDEEPGVGPNQVIRQAAPNTGAAENGVIVRIGDGGTNDGFTYPPNQQIIRVTVTPQ